jgi:hypothetical protein
MPTLLSHALKSTACLVGLVFGATSSIAQESTDSLKPANSASAPSSPKTTSCIQLNQIERTEILDDQTMIFHMRGNKAWKNKLPNKCPRLKFEGRYLFKTSINSICNTDIITVLFQTGGGVSGLQEGASCGLGTFEEFKPLPKTAKQTKQTQ